MDDAELVGRARGGDRSAWAAIYDRYADRLHDHCWSILRDEHEAADALHDAFVNAAGAIGQLRDPSRLRPWLYSIARNEAFRRHRRRKRAVPTDELPEMSAADDVVDGGGAGGHDLQQLVWDAAGGLSVDDQAILDLHLRQGLDGQDLAEALGITANNGYVKLHRLRETLERSLGALLVARTGSDDCDELQQLTAGWDGTLSPLLRKRIARHVDSCEICGERKRRMVSPMALLAGVPLVPAPALLRHRTIDDAVEASSSSSSRPRRGDGPRRRGGWLLASAAAVVVLAVVAALIAASGDEDPELVAAGDTETTTTTEPEDDGEATTTTAEAGAIPTVTTAVVGAPDSTPVTEPVVPGTTQPPVVAPPGQPTTTTTAGPTTTTSTTAPPAPGTIQLDVTDLAFGDTATTKTFTVRNGGGRPIDVSAAGSIGALSVAPGATTLAPGQSASFTVALDRSSLPEGAVTARVRVVGSEAGTQLASANVGVTATVRRPPTVAAPTLSKTTFQNACNSANSISTVTVNASDDSGIASIVLHWSGPGSPGQKNVSGTTTTLGPFPVGTVGTGQAWLVVTDVNGNTTTSPTTSFTVQPCPG